MRYLILTLFFVLLPGSLIAAEGSLMHCFYFTVIDGASDTDWKAFGAATDALPGKIPELKSVWHGKLRRPMRLVSTDRATSKKLRAGEKDVTGPVSLTERQHGVCMEISNEAGLKAYADHPAHAEWMAAYEKVRQPGTTTVDIVGK